MEVLAMPASMNGLALAMARHRKTHDLSQTAACEVLGFTQTKLSRIELGHTRPYKDIPIIADWLEISTRRALHLLETPAGADKDMMMLTEQVADIEQANESRYLQILDELAGLKATLSQVLEKIAPPPPVVEVA